ncbi:MAG: hypothetical protein JXR63_11820 [Spirochaetales bacterium]|nr:hypothetical protein [Spirochaetales bacterium]
MMQLRNISFFMILLIVLFSCSTIDTEIAEGSDAETILIKAQKQQSKAKSDSEYQAVMGMYLNLLSKFPDDILIGVVAKYEIGFISYKLKDYDEAKKWFGDVVETYENYGKTLSGYPVWTYKLAQTLLEKIEEILNPKEEAKEEVKEEESKKDEKSSEAADDKDSKK